MKFAVKTFRPRALLREKGRERGWTRPRSGRMRKRGQAVVCKKGGVNKAAKQPHTKKWSVNKAAKRSYAKKVALTRQWSGRMQKRGHIYKRYIWFFKNYFSTKNGRHSSTWKYKSMGLQRFGSVFFWKKNGFAKHNNFWLEAKSQLRFFFRWGF